LASTTLKPGPGPGPGSVNLYYKYVLSSFCCFPSLTLFSGYECTHERTIYNGPNDKGRMLSGVVEPVGNGDRSLGLSTAIYINGPSIIIERHILQPYINRLELDIYRLGVDNFI
jgi:hypothetical protein